MNDLPVETLLAPCRENVWVDWIAGASVEGVRATTITVASGKPSCLFCACPNPQRYCTGFSGPVKSSEMVCNAFAPIAQPNLHCASYAPGEEPLLLVHDVTSGRAARFARRAQKLVHASAKPEEAFRRALAECRRESAYREPIPVAPGSFDLVTSSMVASQFDAEPYTYFAKLLELKFGRDAILQKEDRLSHLMEELRTELFRVQMEGHAEEMHRMVRKDRGRAYFSVEIFRAAPKGDQYFLVHEIPQALAVLRRHFHFDLDAIPHDRMVRATKLGDATSFILSTLLVPK